MDNYKTMELGWINYMMMEVTDDIAGRNHTKKEWNKAYDKVMGYTLILLEEKYFKISREKNVQVVVSGDDESREISSRVSRLLEEFKVELNDDYSGGVLGSSEWETGWDFKYKEDKEQYEPIIKQMFE
jgi:hypothetical protein